MGRRLSGGPFDTFDYVNKVALYRYIKESMHYSRMVYPTLYGGVVAGPKYFKQVFLHYFVFILFDRNDRVKKIKQKEVTEAAFYSTEEKFRSLENWLKEIKE